MEAENLPLSSSNLNESSTKSLEAPIYDDKVISNYSLNASTYPLETLEVKNIGEDKITKAIAPQIHSTAFYKRKAVIISLFITLFVVLLTGLAISFAVKRNASNLNLNHRIPIQDIKINKTLTDQYSSDLEMINELMVRGDIISTGDLKVVNEGHVAVIGTELLSDNILLSLPNSSGTFCLDSNNCKFADQEQLTAIRMELDKIMTQVGNRYVPETFRGVEGINGQNGSIVVQGTTGRINVDSSNGIIQISTDQDISKSSSPTFANLLLNGDFTLKGGLKTGFDCSTFANGGALTAGADGAVVCSDDDRVGIGSSSSTIGAIAMFTGNQMIGDSILSQSGSTIKIAGNLNLSNALSYIYGGTGVNQTPSSGQILIGNGAGYNLATLSQGSGISINNSPGGISIEATLGTEITSAKIVDGTIKSVDLSTTNNPNDNEILTFHQGTGGFSWRSANDLIGFKVDTVNGFSGNISLHGVVGNTTISNSGNTISIGLDSNVSLLGQSIGSGEIENGAVLLGAHTTGNYVSEITSLVGLTSSSNIGAGSVVDLSVVYGASANTAVQGNETVTCASGVGNLSGGGNILTLGNGGVCSNISIVNNPNFSTSVTTPLISSVGPLNIQGASINLNSEYININGSNSLSLGTNLDDLSINSAKNINISSQKNLNLSSADSFINLLSPTKILNTLEVIAKATIGSLGQAGIISIHDGLGNLGNLSTNNLSNNRQYFFPDEDGTICLTSGNCVGSMGGSAPADASYLLLGGNSSLSNERILTLGSNLNAIDGGPGGAFNVSVNIDPSFNNVNSNSIEGNYALSLSSGVLSPSDLILNSSNDLVMSANTGIIKLQSDTDINGDFMVNGMGFTVNSTSNNIGVGMMPTSDAVMSLRSESSKMSIFSQGENDLKLASDHGVVIMLDNNNSDDDDNTLSISTANFKISSNGDLNNPLFVVFQNGLVYTKTLTVSEELYIENIMSYGTTAITFLSDGAPSKAVGFIDINNGVMNIWCEDPDGCELKVRHDLTFPWKNDTGYITRIVNMGNFPITIRNSISDYAVLSSDFVGGKYSSISFVSNHGLWIETARSVK